MASNDQENQSPTMEQLRDEAKHAALEAKVAVVAADEQLKLVHKAVEAVEGFNAKVVEVNRFHDARLREMNDAVLVMNNAAKKAVIAMALSGVFALGALVVYYCSATEAKKK